MGRTGRLWLLALAAVFLSGGGVGAAFDGAA